MKDMNLTEGDEVDISDIVVPENKTKKRVKNE